MSKEQTNLVFKALQRDWHTPFEIAGDTALFEAISDPGSSYALRHLSPLAVLSVCPLVDEVCNFALQLINNRQRD